MVERIAHRGPDGRGHCTVDECTLGNVRLSVVDKEGGQQPQSSANGRHHLVFNGELYGYQKLRQSLLQRGYPFVSQGDTEVLLAQLATDGLDCLGELDGMFAFAWYDKQSRSLVLARDHFGIKPLLYTLCHNRLYFASEAKAFYAIPEWQPRADLQGWHSLFNIRFVPSPRTLFEGVKKVPPGCYLLVQPHCVAPLTIPPGHSQLNRFSCHESTVRLIRYYSPNPPPFSGSFAQAAEQLRNGLSAAVSRQLVADVKTGIYLSAGLDSSALAASARSATDGPLSTFCLGFGLASDENSAAARMAAFVGTQHHDHYLDGQPLDHFIKTVYHAEEPKVNALQSYLLAAKARQEHTVMLSGLGGDELFGGYDIYAIGAVLDAIERHGGTPVARCGATMLQAALHCNTSLRLDTLRRGCAIVGKIKNPLAAWLLLRNGWDHNATLRKTIYRHDWLGGHALPLEESLASQFCPRPTITESFMRFELGTKMVDDFLLNEDRMSMAHGLEVRVPFLDRTVVELALSLPLTWKINPQQRKIILRHAMQPLLPPWVFERKKQGFSFDPVEQFSKDLGSFARHWLTRERVDRSGLFNYSYIEAILRARPHRSLRWHYFLLWKIAGYHLWEDIFINRTLKVGPL
jgi:asparagine synthase (glutamine-hydrolysing)